MNLAGFILAFVGAVLLGIAQWRVNPLVGMWSVNFIRVEGRDDDFRRILKLATLMTRIGWSLMGAGFLLQVWAAARS
ncbi:MAG: hypothetical protein ACLQU2_37335 [Candidatus Binataceae bacterium]